MGKKGQAKEPQRDGRATRVKTFAIGKVRKKQEKASNSRTGDSEDRFRGRKGRTRPKRKEFFARKNQEGGGKSRRTW